MINLALDGGTPLTRTISTNDTDDNLLGLANNQYFYRLSGTFAHSATATQIQFTVSTDEPAQQYGIAQCVLLAQLCSTGC